MVETVAFGTSVLGRGADGHRRLNELISLRGDCQCRNIVVVEEPSAIARGLGQFVDEGGLARMLTSLVAASHEFIGIADLEGKALFVNEAGRKLVGLRDLEAVHSTRIIDYFASDDQRKVLQEVLRLLFAIPAFGKGN
jgi:PAS domain-containing protein